MITLEEYNSRTRSKRPVCMKVTSLSWYADFYEGGRLVRYSSLTGSERVQVSDMFGDVNIDVEGID